MIWINPAEFSIHAWVSVWWCWTLWSAHYLSVLLKKTRDSCLLLLGTAEEGPLYNQTKLSEAWYFWDGISIYNVVQPASPGNCDGWDMSLPEGIQDWIGLVILRCMGYMMGLMLVIEVLSIWDIFSNLLDLMHQLKKTPGDETNGLLVLCRFITAVLEGMSDNPVSITSSGDSTYTILSVETDKKLKALMVGSCMRCTRKWSCGGAWGLSCSWVMSGKLGQLLWDKTELSGPLQGTFHGQTFLGLHIGKTDKVSLF